MPSISQRLGLVKPSRTDPFVTADIANNWQKIDDAPGAHICTSTTRPTWGAGQAGRLIIENDTKLMWRWTGTVFERTGPSGILRRTNGAEAIARMTTNWTTTSTTYRIFLTITNVVVPAGGRPIEISTSYPRIKNLTGLTEVAVIRSATADGVPIVDRWAVQGEQDVLNGVGGESGMRVSLDTGLAPGTYNYSLQMRAWLSGQETIVESGARPATMWIKEI